MGERTGIEWTGSTWTPIRARHRQSGKLGWHCVHASEGCRHCYAETMNGRLGTGLPFKPGHAGDVEIILDEAMLMKPLRWRKPRPIFVCSMTDLFADFAPDEMIDRVFAVMALAPQHTFQALTKRAARMRAYLSDPAAPRRIYELACEMAIELQLDVVLIAPGTDATFAPAGPRIYLGRWPLPNVWLGVSAEDQKRADVRIPELLATPAAIRFVSAEPLLGPIDFRQWQHSYGCGCGWGGDSPLDYCTNCGWRGHAREALGVVMCPDCRETITDYNACPECDGHDGDGMSFGPNHLPPLDWIIVGGESGPNARPMHPDWARSIRDQCATAGIAFFFKQWGEWQPRQWCRDGGTHALNRHPNMTFQKIQSHPNSIERVGAGPDWVAMAKVGKKAAGRILDDAEYSAMPDVAR